MHAVLMTREYPPDVYGGAGVHVGFLARELARLIDVEVRHFGEPGTAPGRREGEPVVHGFGPWEALRADEPHASALRSISVDLAMADGLEHPDLVHSHTWYANLAGHLAKLLHDIPHVVTSHSLEPLRPWKAEQLGAGGYALSCFCERTGIESADAVIGVSAAMREDILTSYPAVDPARVHVIHNGVDTEEYAPDPATDALERWGVDSDRPSVLFVGRITRQKGIVHLLNAAAWIDPAAQLVFCASSPDTEEIARETQEAAARVRRTRDLVWIDAKIPNREVVQLMTHAAVFCCPSIYEPLGIVNLEAMACETPVVATDTGGIPEVVVDGETGRLVPFDPGGDPDRSPRDPERFARDIAERVNEVLADPERARAMGEAGRRRVLAEFSWREVARRTLDLYRSLV